jgi:hypothetical protein
MPNKQPDAGNQGSGGVNGGIGEEDAVGGGIGEIGAKRGFKRRALLRAGLLAGGPPCPSPLAPDHRLPACGKSPRRRPGLRRLRRLRRLARR